MLGKLFKSKKAPKNDGDLIDQSHISNLRLKKVYELELVNMEGSPRYRLTSKLGFGSEIGEVLIADDSISPRHCTFTLEQDVITLIDHNSVNGTLVNGVQIEPGKNLILDEDDEIQIGELLVKIRTYNEAVVKEKKASLATLPEASFVEEAIDEEEKIDEEEFDDKELVTQLTQLDDKLQDDADLKPFESEGDSLTSNTSLLEEKGIKVEELIKPEVATETDNIPESEENEALEESVEEVEASEEDDIEDEVDIEEDEEIEEVEKNKKIEKKVKIVKKPQYAANTILRIVALHVDLCLAYGTYLLLVPFDDFNAFVSMIVNQSNELISLGTNSQLYQSYGQHLSFLLEMFKDLWAIIDNYINPIPTLIIFTISKLLFTLLLGVSLGQLLVGMKSSGNVVWKRVGGVMRTLIGFITFPFLVFDIGAVISRRTFKEFITFTRIYSDSKILNIFLSIVFVCVSGLFVLVAPLFQGLEATKRYEMPEKVQERVRFQDSESDTEEGGKAFISRFLGVKLELSDEFEVFPGFKFEGSSSKTSSQFVLNVFDKKMQGNTQLEILKRFDIRQLLAIGFKGNPFLKLKFPHLDNFVHEHTPTGFKKSTIDNESFAQEFMEFHRIAMDMSIESYFDHMKEIPMVGSLLDYKQSFLALIETHNVDDMSFVKMGDIIALKMSFKGARAQDYILPILSEGKILKVTFKGENPEGLASRLYRYAFYHSEWTEQLNMTAFDRILNALKEQKEVELEDAQAIYGFYYELAQKVLSDISEEEYELLKSAVKSVQLLIEGVRSEESEALMKLDSNFKDLVDAVEIQNLEYFNLSETTLL